jgi:hypothetical protein
MRIRRKVIVAIAAALLVLMLAGPVSAGGRPDPQPDWVGPAIVLVVFGAIFASIVIAGSNALRRRR